MFYRLAKQLASHKKDVWIVSATWLAPLLGMIGGLIAARHLAPEDLGVVQAVLLIPSYVGFLQFGVFNGLNRNLPLFRAKGEPDKVQGFVNASAKMARYVAIAGALIALAAVLAFFVRSGNSQYTYVALFLIPGLIFGPLTLHKDTLFRGMQEFERVGKNLHIINLWNLLCAASTSVIGVTGLAIKIGTQSLLGWLLFLRNPPIKERGKASWQDIKTLSAVGMPMLISGVIFTWLTTADRTVIATFLTAEDLGYFTLAGIAMNSLKAFPDSINKLLYPRVAHAYGLTGSSRQLRRYIWIGFGLNLAVMIPVVTVGWFALPYLVKTFLPAYSPGILAAQITLVGALAFAYSGPSVIIPILRRNLPVQVAGVLAIGLVWGGGIYAIHLGYGIVGVAVARAVATGFYGLFVLGFVFYLTHRDFEFES
ncbi:oligosaccharide flippase family protein [Akkermansiaceae bacterium]|nr:oligosaccharide flippase family protein [Akkermansiaceae bacterium]